MSVHLEGIKMLCFIGVGRFRILGGGGGGGTGRPNSKQAHFDVMCPLGF